MKKRKRASAGMEKLKLDYAVAVEGRDDVAAVSRACEALLIPTHGFGITKETWALLAKAYEEKGLIVLTDPDFSGEEIRRKLTERFPEALQAFVPQDKAIKGDDIGVENAEPEVIREALEKAIERERRGRSCTDDDGACSFAEMRDLQVLGLQGEEGAEELRRAVSDMLGIGCGNSKALLRKLKYWKIGKNELEQTVRKIKEKEHGQK